MASGQQRKRALTQDEINLVILQSSSDSSESDSDMSEEEVVVSPSKPTVGAQVSTSSSTIPSHHALSSLSPRQRLRAHRPSTSVSPRTFFGKRMKYTTSATPTSATSQSATTSAVRPSATTSAVSPSATTSAIMSVTTTSATASTSATSRPRGGGPAKRSLTFDTAKGGKRGVGRPRGRKRGAGRAQPVAPTSPPSAHHSPSPSSPSSPAIPVVRTWHNTPFNPVPLCFTGTPGMKVPVPSSPLGFCQLFITRELLQYLFVHCNIYAHQILHDHPQAMAAWMDVNEGDMARFLGLYMLMGLDKLPEITDYWSRHESLEHPAFHTTMKVKRFKEILRFFHTLDNSTIPENNKDRLIKVRPVFTYLLKRFQDVYTPEQHLSLDEGTMKWRGKLSFKVYMPNKPDKYSVKLYILAEARSGYVHNFSIYQGTYSSLHDTVFGLLGDLSGKGYRLYMDNYYNSVTLSENLRDSGTDICGTLRLVRGAPKDMAEAAKSRGFKVDSIKSKHTGKVQLLLWKDRQVVNMVTTFHSTDTVPMTRRRRKRRKNGTTYLEETEINKPVCITNYNKYMSGVDKFDQMISYYEFIRKTHKWTKKLTMYLLQMALYNSYALYVKHTDKPLVFKKYHLLVVTALRNFKPEEWPLSGVPLDHTAPLYPAATATSDEDSDLDDPALATPTSSEASTPAATPSPTPASRSDDGASSSRRVVDFHARLDNRLHHSAVKVGRQSRKRCRVCSRKGIRKDTYYICRVCNIPLCLADCYDAYHHKSRFWL